MKKPRYVPKINKVLYETKDFRLRQIPLNIVLELKRPYYMPIKGRNSNKEFRNTSPQYYNDTDEVVSVLKSEKLVSDDFSLPYILP